MNLGMFIYGLILISAVNFSLSLNIPVFVANLLKTQNCKIAVISKELGSGSLAAEILQELDTPTILSTILFQINEESACLLNLVILKQSDHLDDFKLTNEVRIGCSKFYLFYNY